MARETRVILSRFTWKEGGIPLNEACCPFRCFRTAYPAMIRRVGVSLPPKDAKIGTVSPVHCIRGCVIHTVGRGRPTTDLSTPGIAVEVHEKALILCVYVYIWRSDVVTPPKNSVITMQCTGAIDSVRPFNRIGIRQSDISTAMMREVEIVFAQRIFYPFWHANQ